MQLKTFQARTMTDALAKVKTDLGGGAMILHTRSVKRGGWLGLGARTYIEITATADPRIDEARVQNAKSPDDHNAEANDLDKTVERSTSNPQSEIHDPQFPPPPAPDASMQRDLIAIRSMVRDLLSHRLSANAAHGPPPDDMPAELIEYYSRLTSQQVAQELVTRLMDKVSHRLRTNSVQRGSNAPYWDAQGRLVQPVPTDHQPLATDYLIREELAELLPPAAPLELTAEGRPTIVALVGPTGVGKTTTLAKLAAHMKLRERRRVGLITIDTYRIAAVEQLKTYAQILEIPLAAVTTPGEIQDAVKQMYACDLILIDTAGRSPRDEPRIAQLAELLAAVRPDQVHLVLSTTSREETIREAAEKFAVLGPRQVIFTKLDEAVGFGVIVNVLHNLNLRLSYLTTGQSVPDDIEPATAHRIAQLILGEAESSPADTNRNPKSEIRNTQYEALA
jgi:flagellar biosynthesis protein FlhF